MKEGMRTARDYGPRRLIVELTNICNLHCSYCLRDEDALYHSPTRFFSLDLLRRVIREGREELGVEHIMFTGGEPTLHPQFKEVLEAVKRENLRSSFVTNGWHFERVWPAVEANREAVSNVAFSLDGATREAHDRWRGEGSFVRLIRAFARCHSSGVPFIVKVGLRRDTLPHLEEIVMLAARLGASGASFTHLLPTPDAAMGELGLSVDERAAAEREIAALASIFRMKVSLDVGYFNTDPEPPCSALAGVSCNIDFKGRLSLCCNLSGYRGGEGERDVVGDLNLTGLAEGFARLRGLAGEQLDRRRAALVESRKIGSDVDAYTHSPCLMCLRDFGKVGWSGESRLSNPKRALPVVGGA